MGKLRVPPPTLGESANPRPWRLLYVMHVDWRWIKQRPHFLAEELSALPDIDLRVAFAPSWRMNRLVESSSPVRRIALPVLPFRRHQGSHAVSACLTSLALSTWLRGWTPDWVVVTAPDMLGLIEPAIQEARLCYDCMDVSWAFHEDRRAQDRVRHQEARLLGRVDCVTASSQYLLNSLHSDYGYKGPEQLVPNGFSPTALGAPLPKTKRPQHEGYREVHYFGTVAAWVDFNLLVTALKVRPTLTFHLWGPVAADVPNHPRLVVHGPVPHSELRTSVERAAAFMLPFRVDALTLGVDPVKLYEYLWLDRPVLSVRYPELDRFAPYVFFFEGLPSFLDALDTTVFSSDRSGTTKPSAREFLKDATWTRRANDFWTFLGEISDRP